MRFISPRVVGVVLLLSLPILAVVYYHVNPGGAERDWLPRCFFHDATGLHCPGCGSQRALHSILVGDLASALRYNPLAILLAPLLLYYGAPSLYFMIAKNRYRELYMPSWLVITLAVLVLSYFVLRNIPIAPFTLLAPK